MHSWVIRNLPELRVAELRVAELRVAELHRECSRRPAPADARTLGARR
jgi:hypothetical protein